MDNVGICNLALQRLGARSISSLTDDSTNARECNRVFDHARDSELRAYQWNFARARASIAASSTAPAFEFAYKYPLPADWVRTLPQKEVTDWQIEGRYILTNDKAPLQLIYLKRVTDPEEFDDLFTELLISRIAYDICEKITQSNSKKAEAKDRYDTAVARAKKVDSFESIPKEAPASSWDTVRL
jgi:hypothetical protein